MTTRTQREIREFFTTEQGFVDLMFEMGVGNNERNRIVDDGFNSFRDLIEQYEHDIEAFRAYLKTLNRIFGSSSDRNKRVYFPPRVMSRLVGMLYYGVISYYACHMLPDFSLLTPDYAMDCFKYYENLNKEENPEAEKEIELDIPDFKGASNWRSFKDLITMRLSLIKGRMSHPIDYVIDETDRHVKRVNASRMFVDTVPITDEDFLKTHVVHFGTCFKDDNKRVWNVLKSNLHETPAYDHIIEFDKRKDGRKAWSTLKQFYEGEDYKQRLQDEAFGILTSTVYRGESQRYNFISYVNRHVKAHKLLISAEYNKDPETGKVNGMDESTKIQHLKTGIKLEAGLEAQLSTARTIGKQRGTFSDYVSYLQGEVDAKNLRKSELKAAAPSRNVSKVDHDRNNSNSNITSQVVEGKRVEAKRYTKEEWLNLTRKQRRAVVNMNFNLRKKNKNKRNKNTNIKSIQSSMKEDLIAVGDAIVAKISGVSLEDDDVNNAENKKGDEQESSEPKPSKRKVKFGGVGDMLAKRRRA